MNCDHGNYYDDVCQTYKEVGIRASLSTFNLLSLIAGAQNQLGEAIEHESKAIDQVETIRNYHKKHPPNESEAAILSLRESTLYLNRGVLHFEAGKYHEALRDYHQTIHLQPLRADAYLHRGLTHLFLQDYPKALNDFNAAIELDPHHPDCYKQRALAHFLNHSLEQASQDLKQAHLLEDRHFFERIDVGLQCFSKGEFQKSIEYFSQFIEDYPQSYIGYQNRGVAYFQQDSLQEALQDFNQALILAPSRALGQLYELRSLILFTLSQFELAEADLLRGIELNPHSLSAYLNLSAIYLCMKKWDEALKMN